jgi:hypothetical protein
MARQTSDLSWSELIGKSVELQRELAATSPLIWSDRRPREPATESEIAEWEGTSSIRLPVDYRSFLHTCSGANIDLHTLFGLPELRGDGAGRVGGELLQYLTDEYDEDEFAFANVIPVGVIEDQTSVILLNVRGPAVGEVWWFDTGRLVERYASFRAAVERLLGFLEAHVRRAKDRSLG